MDAKDPTAHSTPATDCHITRFIFEHLDICGAIVQLSSSWQQMHAGRGYAPPVQSLLGEMAAVAAVIGSNLKTAGRVTFQAQGEASEAVSLLVVDCECCEQAVGAATAQAAQAKQAKQAQARHALLLRGMARSQAQVQPGSLHELLGKGQLLFTLRTAAAESLYQSYVDLAGENIAQVFEQFMTQSAQQPTRLWLFADAAQASCLYLQTLPAREQTTDSDGWNRVQQMAATVTPAEMQLPANTLLGRLFAEDDLRVFAPISVHYHCPRDEDKVRNMLLSLGYQEVMAILTEFGEIVIRDDICNHEYRFGAEIVEELFPSAGQTLH